MPDTNTHTSTIKTSHKAITAFYEARKQYAALNVTHETGVRTAFIRLLEDTAKAHDWVVITEQTMRATDGNTIRPDATLLKNALPRGHYEAKDSGDDLEAEIRRKIGRGYPLNNTIFEDSNTAVLYQSGKRINEFALNDPAQLARLLNDFYGYSEPIIAHYDAALEKFREDVPRLAAGLKTIISDAHQTNQRFITAFAAFYELCKTALNPNISTAAVEDMLVQHLLTERLFRKIFENPDFTRRNVIAAEVEKVIDALTSASFSRDAYLRSLDSYYTAIEDGARGLDFSQKQNVLNTVYERFFQGYNRNVADTHGIVYTPQPIVDFMCASVVEVLQTEFGKSLGDPDVVILDPATGTGNFIVNLLRRVPGRDLPDVYRSRLFANEIMLLPYYIAALNIEHTYNDLTGSYEPFEGLCFVDTLDLAEGKQMKLAFMTEKNTERVERQKKAPMMVIIGNPPYNAHQANENDNNKNRRYEVIDKRINETYAKDSTATNKNALSDAYVKFYRWSTDRLQDRPGIVCMVTNNGFLRGIAFDGFRKHMQQDFDCIYHFDFRGNARTSGELRRQEGGNIFNDQIRTGIGITLLIRTGKKQTPKIHYHTVGDYWRADQKKKYVESFSSMTKVDWQTLTPDKKNAWLTLDNAAVYAAFMPIGSKETKAAANANPESIFKTFGRGIVTCRDNIVFDFNASQLESRVEQFSDLYNGEVDRYKRMSSKPSIDSFVNYKILKWSMGLKLNLKRGKYSEFRPEKIRQSIYRPFCRQFLYFDSVLNEADYQFPQIFPTANSEAENRIICVTGPGNDGFRCLAANRIVELKFSNSTNGGTQCFPFYVYDPDGTNRRENITDWALEQFRTYYADPTISKWDIFYYVYGVLHQPGYRETFADNLKRELPRIPFVALTSPPSPLSTNGEGESDDKQGESGKAGGGFWAFAEAGRKLADLHLNYETVEQWKLTWVEAKDVPFSWRVEKMKLSKDKTELVVNPSLTLKGIPAEAFAYRLGNRSALEWVIDQYQVTEDKRSGIKSDPNRLDDERYIVELVGRVVRVSVETARIVAGLPGLLESVVTPDGSVPD